MRILILFLMTLLAGCEMTDTQLQLQRQLDGYAQNAASGENLEAYLTGEALESALQSAELMQSLGYQQLGFPKMLLLELSDGVGKGCLDLTEVRIVDSAGELVQQRRPERLSFQVSVDDQLRISSLSVGEAC